MAIPEGEKKINADEQGAKAVNNVLLYHYFERNNGFGPFRSFTELPMEEARQILLARKAADKIGNPNIEDFLHKRYGREKLLREAFVARGGRVERASPYYFFLGEERQWLSAYENPACVKIPLSEFDPLTVSFTYGDSFAIFNPALFGKEEYWGRAYFADEMLALINRIGLPPHVEYDFKRGIYPKGVHINDTLRHVEAHVWSDEVAGKYTGRSH
ncbi:MAG: hypothetical protein FWF05_03370 [Oscillospiraceae bacterium]|nr:hypothetical protein [Oscillospiraceae bacterium]